MIILASTSDLLQVVTGQATNVDVHTSWIDDNSGAITPGRTNTPIVTNTTTTIVASPASNVYRNVKCVTIRNTDAANSNAITVQHSDGTHTVTIIKYTLLAGETLMYFDTDGWVVMSASGTLKIASVPSGCFIKSTVLTAGTSFTTSTTTNTLKIRMVGGGGGGGGATSNAGNISAAGGGSSGGYAEKTFSVSPNTAYTYQIGAGGAGGINGANAGNQGTNTFFVVGATNVVANGGPGGAAAPAAGAPTFRAGGALPSQSTSGDLNGSGDAGDPGFSTSTTFALSGKGGCSLFGGAGAASNANGNGASAVNFGSGGAGALTVGAANANGGAGAGGVIVVWEYS